MTELRRGALRLETLDERHVPHLETLVEDPEVRRFTYVPDSPPPGYAEDWARRYGPDRPQVGFAAFDGDGGFVGVGMVPEIDREAAEAEIGYIVAPAARGRGFGTEILAAVTEWLFAEGFVRIFLGIDVANEASLRVGERAGFRREGVMRSVHFKPGKRADLVLMSRLADD